MSGIITASELLAGDWPPTVADVLELGRCSPECLCAASHSECDCRCGGAFHAAARLAELDRSLS